ncbi:hypothetical protein [Bacillus toyonensis]|uniref:hypothetical protein n=1 Tax=Bacillus toyonensis TaxID=155322 RepID=UPI000BF216B3|nr:hypothetical protein [Bacillus toyonensis]PEO64694.1 hypothetical protein CN579_13405 [Bacillus toyonensis]
MNTLRAGIHHIEFWVANLEESISFYDKLFSIIGWRKLNKVADFLASTKVKVIRGPIEMNHYSDGYYTVDFYDPNGFIIEVAYTPNVEM